MSILEMYWNSSVYIKASIWLRLQMMLDKFSSNFIVTPRKCPLNPNFCMPLLMSTGIIPQYEQPSYMNPLWWLLREKCPYLELFWSAFSFILTEYGEIRSISPYSVQMRENADQNNSEYGHFLRSGWCRLWKIRCKKSGFCYAKETHLQVKNN